MHPNDRLGKKSGPSQESTGDDIGLNIPCQADTSHLGIPLTCRKKYGISINATTNSCYSNGNEGRGTSSHTNDQEQDVQFEIPPTQDTSRKSNVHMKLYVPKQRFRGATKLSSLRPERGAYHECMFNDQGSPVGDKAKTLTNYIGVFAKKGMYFPLHKEWDWEHLKGFEVALECIMEDFVFVMMDGETIANMEDVVHWCLNNTQKKVRSWHDKLKEKIFCLEQPDQEQQTSPDKRVTQEQWKMLLEYWKSPRKENECARNKANRGGSRPTHRRGAMSYARKYQEMIEKEDVTSEIEAYLKYHQDSKGGYLNEYTKQKCEEISRKCEELQLEKSINHVAFTCVLDEVYGKHHGGYERGYGGGISRKRWMTAQLQHVKMAPYIKQQSLIKELEAKNDRLREQLRQGNYQRSPNSNDLRTSNSRNDSQDYHSSPASYDAGS